METTQNGDPDEVLHRWRSRVLNGFFSIAALISLPALAAILINAFSTPGTWNLAIAFSIVESLLLILAVWRSLLSSLPCSTPQPGH